MKMLFIMPRKRQFALWGEDGNFLGAKMYNFYIMYCTNYTK